MLSLLSLNNLKTYLIVIGIGFGIWFYKDYQFQKSENKRQSANNEQLRKQDSLRYAELVLNKKEFEEYLEHNRQDLLKFLDEQDIKTRRLERIITQNLQYQDKTPNNINLQPILDAINQKREIKVPVIDSTDCLIVKGYVAFDNDTLSLNITERKFKNKSDVITYWERNKWSFLGLWDWRLFGKKKATVIIKDSCGNTETVVIDKKK